MPLELGWRSTIAHDEWSHRVFVFEKKPYRTLQSTSDINGIDPRSTKEDLRRHGWMRNIFHQPERTTTVQKCLPAIALSSEVARIAAECGQ